MPALLTHYCFALEAKKEGEDKYLKSLLLGTQGPDPFFFYGANPLKKREKSSLIQAYGAVIHHSDFSPTYLAMASYIRSKEEGEEKEVLKTYLDGLIMHYCVDSLCHPYIFYESGVDEKGKLTGYYSWSHKAFEALLDVVLSRKKGHYHPKPSKCMKVPPTWAKWISLMWEKAGPSYIKEDSFYYGYKDYLSIESLIQSHFALKRPIWKMVGKTSAMYGLSYPYKTKKLEKVDPLNLEHRVWQNPVTGQKSQDSFLDLLELAKKKLEKGRAIIEKALQGIDQSKEMAAFIANIDHDGCLIGEKKTRYSLCWKRLPS